MPNLTFNKIRVKNGSCNLGKYISDDGKYFDFGKLVPEPKSAEECLEKYGKGYLDDGNRHLMHTEIDKWFNWYDWHCDFWGTKWNSWDTYYDKGNNIVAFCTAWSEPKPIWRKLSEDNPDCEFEIAADYEEGFNNYSLWKNGEMIHSKTTDYEY